MKVSMSMYGRAGKCVACHQKIRIPRLDEVDPAIEEIHLKEHPEFLRKGKQRKTIAKAGQGQAKPIEKDRSLDVSPQRKRAVALPLDTLPALHLLSNIQSSIGKRLRFLEREGEERYEKEFDNLQQWARRSRHARAKLDETMRQRLIEVSAELSDLRKEITELCLAARVGEIEFALFQKRAEQCRRLRDHLERCQQDLRGWLSIQGVHYTGGRVRVAPDTEPEIPEQIPFPDPPDERVPLLEYHMKSLTEALDHRQEAEKRADESMRMGKADVPAGTNIEFVRGETKAEKRLADVAVKFHRARLEQLREDYLEDLNVCDAQLDQIRDRFNAGDLDRATYQATEQTLVQAKIDLNRGRDLLVRALSANTPREVPVAHPTLLGRLAGGRAYPAPTADVWTAWGAALALVISVFLPLGKMTLVSSALNFASQGSGAYLLIVVPFILALLVASAALVPNARARGLLFGGIWTAALLGGIGYLHEVQYGVSAFDTYLSQYGSVTASPALLISFLAVMSIGVAAVLALYKDKEIRPALAIFPLLVLLGAGALVTDFAGFLSPHLRLESISVASPAIGGHEATCRIPIRNTGRRTVPLSLDREKNKVYALLIDKQDDSGWLPVSGASAEVDGNARSVIVDSTGAPRLLMQPGERLTLQLKLPDGVYRAVLQSKAQSESMNFSVTIPVETPAPRPKAAPIPVVPPPPAPTAEPAVSAVEPAQDSAVPVGQETMGIPPVPAQTVVTKIRFELKGILSAKNRQPQFSIALYLPSGEREEHMLDIGAKIYGPWVVGEYNQTEQTVTVTNGDRMLVVRQGETISLE